MRGLKATLRSAMNHLTTACILGLLLTGRAALGKDEESVERSRRAVTRKCPPTFTPPPFQNVKILVNPIPKPGHKGFPDPGKSENDVLGKEDIPDYGGPGYKQDELEKGNFYIECYDPGPDIKATLSEDSDSWKTRVIIACTIAAAIEIIIILVIIVYWREIRWTMRKIPCPCDERPSRHGDHEAMERTETGTLHIPPPEQRDLIPHTDLEDFDPEDPPGQTFRHPRRSRTEEALDEMAEDTTEL